MRWLLHRIRAAAIYLWRVVVSLETRLRLLGTILHEERKCPPGIPLRRRLWALRHGHFSNRIVLFGLNPGNVHEFIPEIPYLRAHPLNGRFTGLVDGKLQMYAALRDFPQHLPRLFFHVHEGMAFGYDASVPRCARYRPEAVLEVLDREGRLFIKPDALGEGIGVFSVEHRDGVHRVDGREVSREEVLGRLRGLSDHVVTECVEPHPYARDLFPGSLNTVRLMTLREDGDPEPRFVMACHRVGTSASTPADNVGRGGLYGPIDWDTGRLGRFLAYPKTNRIEWHACHPETGALLEGVIVPRWDELKIRILEAARSLAPVQWMGFDVAITPDGFKILEINSLPTIALQAWDPLGRNAAAMRFLGRRMRGRAVRRLLERRRELEPDSPEAPAPRNPA